MPDNESAANPSPIQIGAKFSSGIIPSFVNNFFANYQQRKQNEFNRQQIQEQNEYNSPTATMNRMIAAGISPKAAQESIAGVPTLGAQNDVAIATPYPGQMPGTDFMSGLGQGYANELLDEQAINQRINNKTAQTVNELTIQEMQGKIFGIDLSNRGKLVDLKVAPFIRNLQLANLSTQNLIGLHELVQYELLMAESPYVEYFLSDGGYFSPNGEEHSVFYPSVPNAQGKKDGTFSDATIKRFVENRSKALKSYENELDNQLLSQGIDKSRLNYIREGVSQERLNHLKSLEVEMLRLLAQGKVEELRQKMSEVGLSRKNWLWHATDVFSAFSPMFSALMATTGAYNNIATGVSRNRISHSSHWQMDPSSVSFSW